MGVKMNQIIFSGTTATFILLELSDFFFSFFFFFFFFLFFFFYFFFFFSDWGRPLPMEQYSLLVSLRIKFLQS